jgi:hypothetical protein
VVIAADATIMATTSSRYAVMGPPRSVVLKLFCAFGANVLICQVQVGPRSQCARPASQFVVKHEVILACNMQQLVIHDPVMTWQVHRRCSSTGVRQVWLLRGTVVAGEEVPTAGV